MGREKNLAEARRWFAQAAADLRAAENSPPTRYPNGLPDLTPFEVYTEVEAQAAITAAGGVIAACERLLPAAQADAPKR